VSTPDAVGPAGLLEVEGLSVEFATRSGVVRVVEDVHFRVGVGESVGLVGESGCGKTVTSLAVMGLLAAGAATVTGEVRFDGRDLLGLSGEAMRRLRGDELSMVFQEPMTSLNPTFTVGRQIADVVREHRGGSDRAAWTRAVEMLDRVGIANASARARDYPYTFSGGMRQRVLIAMALACEPRLLIADEPTTALDVTVQAQILELLRSLRTELGMGVLFVTHDLGVVAEICDRVVVMYAGQVVEEAAVDRFFAAPRHPYGEGLLASMPQLAARHARLPVIPGQVPPPDAWPTGCRFHPRCAYALDGCRIAPIAFTATPEGDHYRCQRADELQLAGTNTRRAPASGSDPPPARPTASSPVLVEVRDLAKAFPLRRGVLQRVRARVRAVDGVDFTIRAGETLALVGESGSGKTTTGRLVLRLVEPTRGSVWFDGTDVMSLDRRRLRALRQHMQLVFQDPYSSLDPRVRVVTTVGEPLEAHEGLRGTALEDRVTAALAQVGLDRSFLARSPHELSGGQRQRVAIARALALEPALLVCDEPLSSLDVATKSQVINLLADLQARLGLAYLFISHDLAVVGTISDRIAVMYLGRVVELGDAETVCTKPAHPYTEALLSAIPVADPRARRRKRIVLEGDIASPLDPPSGCRFHPRCPYTMDICRAVDPPPFSTPDGTTVHCHLHTTGPQLAGRSVASLGRPHGDEQPGGEAVSSPTPGKTG
jgi:peptide/nickel transport system ATP-binding protein